MRNNRVPEIELRLLIAELRKNLNALTCDLERLPLSSDAAYVRIVKGILERIFEIEAEIDRLEPD